MRINVYSQELTPEVLHVEKESNTGHVYQAAQLILHSSDRLHHPPEDDDRSAVTFWLPTSEHRREEMAQAFERIAAIFRGVSALQAQQPGGQAVTDELIDEAVNCAWHVAGTTMHSREDIKAAVKAIYPLFVGKVIIAAPALQEVSEAQVDSLAWNIAKTFALHWMTNAYELRKVARAALESYRATLLGEVKP